MNRVSSKISALIFIVIFSFVQSGCLSKKTTIPLDQRLLPAKTATRAELLQMLEKQSQAVKTLSATTVLDVSHGALKTGILTEHPQTKTFVRVERPNLIRLIAVLPLVGSTVFDMVSDGKEYRASIPLKNQFFIGRVDAPTKSNNTLANLRPQHILDALFVDIRPYMDKPNVLEEAVIGRNSYYVLGFIDVTSANAQLIEKIWIDRSKLEVSRKQIFGADGKLETDVQYMDYHSHEGVDFPDLIHIQRPQEDYSLKMTFQNTDLNQQLQADQFRLDRPSGSDLVQLED
jgi:outer membrane lipoprotein-sorting protein